MKKIFSSPKAIIYITFICVLAAVIGIFLTSDKEISPLLPFLFFLLPLFIEIFSGKKQQEETTQTVHEVKEVVEKATQTVEAVAERTSNNDSTKLVEEVQGLYKQIEEQGAVITQLRLEVANMRKENTQLRRLVRDLLRDSNTDTGGIDVQ